MATTTYHAQLIKYLSNGDQYILNLKNTGDDVSISRSSNGNLPAAATSVQGLANSLGALAFKSSLGKGDVGLGNVDNTSDANKSVKYATSAGSAGSATKATQDSSNQTITSTYIKGLSVSGRTITYTKGDGTTGTITTQDNNTTYSTGTSTASGLTKLYTTTGNNTDGTMTQSAITNIPKPKIIILNSDSDFTFVMPYNGFAIIICNLLGWGYDGKPWKFQLIEKNNAVSTHTDLNYGYWDDGTNKIKHPLHAESIFYNMKQGTTYVFCRNTILGAIGRKEDVRFIAYIYPE